MADLEQIKFFIVVAQLLGGLGISMTTVACTFALMRWRVCNLEKVVFGNGKPGLVEELQEMRERCAGNHPPVLRRKQEA